MQNLKLLLVTLGATLLFIFGFGWWFSSMNQQATNPDSTEVISEAELVPTDSYVKGATESARFTIVEFSDFQCPACAQMRGNLETLTTKYPNDVRVVYRHFPLVNIHPNAQASAYAAEAAGRQGKFWEMHNLLFEQQAQWEGLKDPKEFFQGLATQLSLNIETFNQDIQNADLKGKVERDLRAAEQMRLGFTPTLFLNGKQTDITEITQEIDTALAN